MRDEVEDWDEARDPSRAPPKPLRAPWHMLGMADRQVLDALADGTWTPERSLHGLLGWHWTKFLLVTSRMVLVGWIEARQASSVFRSDYRLSAEAWQ
jgi:hypothetical protein